MSPETNLDVALVDALVERYNSQKSHLISILQDVQASLGWLPREVLTHISKKLDIPLIDLYGLATFYDAFRFTPPGRHRITVCMGTACHVRGAPRVLRALEDRLGITAGGTTADGRFSLGVVRCVGACALGPIVVVDDEYHGQATRSSVEGLIERVQRR